MITLKRKTVLHWALNPTAFELINAKSLVVLLKPLRASMNPVTKMLACEEEMRFLLPDVLGMSPESNSSDWNKALSNYWHNFMLDIPSSGYTLNTTMYFDIDDYKRRENIAELAKRSAIKDYKTEEGTKSLFKIICKLDEKEYYKYMYPENVEQYLAWRFALLSGKVANDPKDAKNSTNIDFYLTDEVAVAKAIEKTNALKTQAIKLFYELISKDDSTNAIENIIIAMDSVASLKELTAMSKSNREALLLTKATSEPASFVTTLSDTTISNKAEIKKWVMSGQIRQLPNTSIYTDSDDPSKVLGNNIGEVITYINNIVNSSYVNDIRLKFKNINN